MEEDQDKLVEANRVIDSIRVEHAAIKERMWILLDRSSDAATWKEEYFSFQAFVLQHIEKEDKYLYPFLRQKAKDLPHLASILDEFDSEICAIAKMIENVEQKVEEDSDELGLDLEYLFFLLIFRMSLEEETLFKDYGDVIKLMEHFDEFKNVSSVVY